MTGNPSSQNITSGWSWSRLRDINYFLDNYEKADVTDAVKIVMLVWRDITGHYFILIK